VGQPPPGQLLASDLLNSPPRALPDCPPPDPEPSGFGFTSERGWG
jgi:hypothetical protein